MDPPSHPESLLMQCHDMPVQNCKMSKNSHSKNSKKKLPQEKCVNWSKSEYINDLFLQFQWIHLVIPKVYWSVPRYASSKGGENVHKSFWTLSFALVSTSVWSVLSRFHLDQSRAGAFAIRVRSIRTNWPVQSPHCLNTKYTTCTRVKYTKCTYLEQLGQELSR